ncbi:MAG: SCO family protein [Roseovarius sp.]|nr:SCO family protein [Roseovarius sp.]
MTRIFAIGATVVVVVLLGGLYVMTSGSGGDDPFGPCRSAQIAGGADQIGGPFTLVDEDGQTVTDAQVIDQPSLIYFGYSFCPDVCPMDAGRNAEAVALLEERGTIVKPVFISIDPARDTPDVMKEFTDYLHPRMLGLTGSEEQVKAASKAYRTFYQKQEPEEGEEDYYLVDHSTFSYLVLPEHGFVEFFRRSIEAEEMADQIQCFVDAG